jgi:serine/threonine protein kinase
LANEAQVLTRLQAHRFQKIANIVGYWQFDGVDILATEYIAGTDLELLHRTSIIQLAWVFLYFTGLNPGAFDDEKMLRWCTQLLTVVQDLHRLGICHLDIKPQVFRL